MKRQASAKWNGTLKEGEGWLSTGSGGIDELPYSFNTRFTSEPGTNPEELIGAAHAGCFSMQFASILAKAGWNPVSIETSASINFDGNEGGWTLTSSHLSVEAVVPGIDEAELQRCAEEAKRTCPVSRVLKAELSVEAHLKKEARTSSPRAVDSTMAQL